MMGGGSKKTHESFTVTPTLKPATPGAVTTTTHTPHTTEVKVADSGSSSAHNPITAGLGSSAAPHDPLPGLESAGHAEVEPGASAESLVDISSDIDQVEDQWGQRHVLTPIPDELPAGDGMGTALAVGGADFVDGSATLISFINPTGDEPRQILTATLTPEAEEKLLDALTAPDAPQVPVLVERDLNGRLQLDTEHQIHERLAKAAKSINSKYKKGEPAPDHTKQNLEALDTELEQLHATALPGSAEEEMLQRYRDDIAACRTRIDPSFTTPYDEGGKIAMINPFEKHGTAMVTEMVPDPTVTAEGLSVLKRKASRLDVTKTPQGKTVWDGTSRKPATGTELVVDLGDGYTAVVRPGRMNPPGKAEYGLHNTVEVIAPPGVDTHHQLVAQLGKLNLVNRPMNPNEAEWAYLQRNVWAENLGTHPSVTTALKQAAGIEQAHEHMLLTQRAHLTVGMNDTEIEGFARQLKLDAEADSLSDKLRILRGGVAAAMGHPNAAALTSLPTYRPTPQRVKGWLTWSRLNYNQESTAKAFGHRRLTHAMAHGNVAEVLLSGALVSTERRSMMGIGNVGMSESSDKMTGGSRGVFLRVSTSEAGASLVWDDPAKILARTDWYGYNGDHYGAAVAGAGIGSVSGQTRDPHTAANFSVANNEVIIANGLDLLGADAPSRVRCNSIQQRQQLITDLAQAGVTMIGNRPLHKVITT